LATLDLAATEYFYSKVFGWTFRRINFQSVDYSLATINGQRVAGLVCAAASQVCRQHSLIGLFAVTDVDTAKKDALEHNAKVLVEPRTFPDLGREAVFEDPQGAVFGILALSDGDPPDFLAAPGELIWSSLITSAPEASAAFYQAVFDYQLLELPTQGHRRHLMFASNGNPRASAHSLPPSSDALHPHWLQYIRVEDAAQATEKVQQLGGQILIPPRLDWHGGKVAEVADPTGAGFGLLEW
jgi:predicted enzyme related to lactoylglutathione lyase